MVKYIIKNPEISLEWSARSYGERKGRLARQIISSYFFEVWIIKGTFFMLHFKFIEFDCMTSCDFLDCVGPLYRIQTLLNYTNEPFCAGLKTFFSSFCFFRSTKQKIFRSFKFVLFSYDIKVSEHTRPFMLF